jgi:hypothetical protein
MSGWMTEAYDRSTQLWMSMSLGLIVVNVLIRGSGARSILTSRQSECYRTKHHQGKRIFAVLSKFRRVINLHAAVPQQAIPLEEAKTDRVLELAYEAAKEALKMLDGTLGSTRTRAVSVLTVTALLTSFSAGIGFINTDRTKGPVLQTWSTWLLLGILLLMGALVLFVLWPVPDWAFGPSAGIILDEQAKGRTESHIRQFVVNEMVKGIHDNTKALRHRQAAFRCSVLLLLAEATALVVALSVSK